MCYGYHNCPYERPYTGECSGPSDWKRPDAACNEEPDMEETPTTYAGEINRLIGEFFLKPLEKPTGYIEEE